MEQRLGEWRPPPRVAVCAPAAYAARERPEAGKCCARQLDLPLVEPPWEWRAGPHAQRAL
eukprot:scaffold195736_cov27-Tisochrysis_lutea.AAC.7